MDDLIRWYLSRPRWMRIALSFVLFLWLGGFTLFYVLDDVSNAIQFAALATMVAIIVAGACYPRSEALKREAARAEGRRYDAGPTNWRVAALGCVLIAVQIGAFAGLAAYLSSHPPGWDYRAVMTQAFILVFVPGGPLLALALIRAPLVRYWLKPRPPR